MTTDQKQQAQIKQIHERVRTNGIMSLRTNNVRFIKHAIAGQALRGRGSVNAEEYTGRVIDVRTVKGQFQIKKVGSGGAWEDATAVIIG